MRTTTIIRQNDYLEALARLKCFKHASYELKLDESVHRWWRKRYPEFKRREDEIMGRDASGC